MIISLFDYSGNMVKPWFDAGHTCCLIDLRHPPGINRIKDDLYTIGVNLLDDNIDNHWMDYFYQIDDRFYDNISFISAFPPCTNLAVSGARWFKSKGLSGLIEGLQLFNEAVAFAESCSAPYMIENPVSTVSTYYRKPDHIFQPWQYGDNYTKKTCLWTGNGFVMPFPTVLKEPLDIDFKRIHHVSPGPNRGSERSITPMGFARAVYEANIKQIEESNER